MDLEKISGSSSVDSLASVESVLPSDVIAKLRRLKIQESIITASLEKCNFDQDDHTTTHSNNNLDWKAYSAKLRNNIREIKNSFEDIKIATTDSEDNLKNINIEEIKKDVLNLNGKIKSLENFINTELISLKSEEKKLIRQMNEEPKAELNVKGKVKIQNTQYNEVVPSPIRVLINSPLKCKEVQQFQTFMSKSKNRYGGWNEYNHNIFIQIWNKFYGTDDIVSLENNMKEISCNNLLPPFQHEVYEKIPGIKLEDIMQHSKWYSEFCYLKKAQQEALENWRENKRKIIGRKEKVNRVKPNTEKLKSEKLCRTQKEISNYQRTFLKKLPEDHEFERNQCSLEESNRSSDNEDLFGTDHKDPNTTSTEPCEQIMSKVKSGTFAKPTEQWINRCNDKGSRDSLRYVDNNIENVDKLCIPKWRLRLTYKAKE